MEGEIIPLFALKEIDFYRFYISLSSGLESPVFGKGVSDDFVP
jgi:hypothetical protein